MDHLAIANASDSNGSAGVAIGWAVTSMVLSRCESNSNLGSSAGNQSHSMMAAHTDTPDTLQLIQLKNESAGVKNPAT